MGGYELIFPLKNLPENQKNIQLYNKFLESA
jgi:hypothetical protein